MHSSQRTQQQADSHGSAAGGTRVCLSRAVFTGPWRQYSFTDFPWPEHLQPKGDTGMWLCQNVSFDDQTQGTVCVGLCCRHVNVCVCVSVNFCTCPSAATATEVLAYIQAYADHYQLHQHIRFQSRLLNVSRAGSNRSTAGYDLVIKDLLTRKHLRVPCTHLVLATGLHSNPVTPKYKVSRFK